MRDADSGAEGSAPEFSACLYIKEKGHEKTCMTNK